MKQKTFAFLFVVLVLPSVTQARAPSTVDEVFARLRDDKLRLRAFIADMPKGGDLHNHLDGSIYAESFLDRARQKGFCIDVRAHAIRPPPCTAPAERADDALAHTPGLRDEMIDAFSMRDFVPTPGDASGHDHFFAAFAKFGAVSHDAVANLAEEATRAAAEHTSYLETMSLPRRQEAAELGEKAAWHGEDFARDLADIAPRLGAIVDAVRHDTDAIEADMRARLGCGATAAPPACQVLIRYQAFSLRTMKPQSVFAQIAFGFALAAADPRYVGVNIVAPEDDPVALRDYTLHMRMMRFFHQANPGVKLSLHAGELAFGLVPPEALGFHIRQAVEIAGADRIGHGTDAMLEDDPGGLLAEMAQLHVAVEINQTSNAQILGVTGAHHPFSAYREAGVPVVISTDDEGIERTDHTEEFFRAAETWHLSYRDLKTLARNSILYSFLPGVPLKPGGVPDARLLAASEKARMQWRLEQDFSAFEKRVLHQRF